MMTLEKFKKIENNPLFHKHDRKYAINAAKKYGLEKEVTHAIDVLHMTPDEAMMEWDV